MRRTDRPLIPHYKLHRADQYRAQYMHRPKRALAPIAGSVPRPGRCKFRSEYRRVIFKR